MHLVLSFQQNPTYVQPDRRTDSDEEGLTVLSTGGLKSKTITVTHRKYLIILSPVMAYIRFSWRSSRWWKSDGGPVYIERVGQSGRCSEGGGGSPGWAEINQPIC